MENSPKSNHILPKILSGLNRLRLTPDRTTLRHQKILNKLAVFTTLYFSAFLLLYHAIGDSGKIGWQNAYYFWDKSCDVLFFLILYIVVPKHRSVILPIIFYTIVRLCFQVITIIWAVDTNATRIKNTLYLILLAIFIIECIKELMHSIKGECQQS